MKKYILILTILVSNIMFGSEIGLKGIQLGDDGNSSCSKMEKIIIDKIDIWKPYFNEKSFRKTEKLCGLIVSNDLTIGLEMDQNNKVQRIRLHSRYFGFNMADSKKVVAQGLISNLPWIKNLETNLSRDKKSFDYEYIDFNEGFKITISDGIIVTLEKTAKLNF
ncbi:hypothetical protein [Arcobacter sp. s6]|uniref:hypothetical protein n=1 Tax=Arcobacter sp. s6 TaxID=3230363 RepID=UPI0034A069D4